MGLFDQVSGGGGGMGFVDPYGGGGGGGMLIPGFGGMGGGGGGGYNPYGTGGGGGGGTGAIDFNGLLNWYKKNNKGPGGEQGQGNPTNGIAGDTQNKPIRSLADLKDRMSNGGEMGLGDLVASMPGYTGILDQNGNPDKNFKFDYSGSDGYKRMKEMALSKGPTDMYGQNVNAIDLNTNRGVSDLSTRSATNYGNAVSSLAQTGGVDAGARERLADSNNLANLTAAQDLYAGGASQKAGALIADTQMKNQMLGQVTGYDINAENLNKNAAINDLYNKNQNDLAAWGKLGDIYGSDQTSKAMLAAANKEDPGMFGMGGFLGTGLGGQKGLGGSGFGSQSWDDKYTRGPLQRFGIGNYNPTTKGGK